MANENTLNGGLFADADVFVDLTAAGVIPVNGADYASPWDAVGILNGDDGFAGDRTIDTTDVFGWGGILVDSVSRNFKTTRAFTVMEENQSTMALIWPGSTLSWSTSGGMDTYSGDLIQPDYQRQFRLGFRQYKGLYVRDYVTAGYATLATVDITEGGETNAYQAVITCNIFPDTSGDDPVYFTVRKGLQAT